MYAFLCLDFFDNGYTVDFKCLVIDILIFLSLIGAQQNIFPSFETGAESWTKEIINKQIDILILVLNIEKENIGLFEKELGNGTEP